jgi:hypothetical protein
MRTISALVGLAFSLGALAAAPLAADEIKPEALPEKAPLAPAEAARAAERWKAFKEHMEGLGRKDLLPEETPGAKAPSNDAMIGILFRLSSDIAAAHDMLTSEPPDVAGARARLKRLEGTKDPYLSDYATLLAARADLLEKKYPEASRGFDSVIGSSRNLATPMARRGLAESYRGMGETTLEILELRFLIGDLPPDRSADRDWAETRLAEIRRDHSGPLEDSAKRMQALSTRLASVGKSGEDAQPAPVGEQKKVEDILLKIAKLLDDESGRCKLCSSVACKACKKCGACTASGMCPGGQHAGLVKVQGNGQNGAPRGHKQGGPADRSKVAKGDPGEKKLRDPAAKDQDAWGSINEREVAKSLQDLWGKIPPSYRQVVSQYFKDISGLAPSPPASK